MSQKWFQKIYFLIIILSDPYPSQLSSSPSPSPSPSPLPSWSESGSSVSMGLDGFGSGYSSWSSYSSCTLSG